MLREPREIPIDSRANDASELAPIATIRSEAQVLLGRQAGERAAPLGHVRDTEARDLLGGQAIDAPPVEDDASFARDHPADRAAEASKFSRAVGAEDHGHPSAPDLEIDVVEDVASPVAGAQALDREQAHDAVPRYARMTSRSFFTSGGDPVCADATPEIEDDHPVRDPHDHVHVMLDEQDGQAPPVLE